MSLLRQAAISVSRAGRNSLRLTLARQASDYTMIVSASDFEEKVIKSKKPVIVDFTATW
jgi:thioredoxin-like negative regulator of GroEL